MENTLPEPDDASSLNQTLNATMPHPPISKHAKKIVKKLLKIISKYNIFREEDLQELFSKTYVENTHLSHKQLG